jgi:hypothetical protein
METSAMVNFVAIPDKSSHSGWCLVDMDKVFAVSVIRLLGDNIPAEEQGKYAVNFIVLGGGSVRAGLCETKEKAVEHQRRILQETTGRDFPEDPAEPTITKNKKVAGVTKNRAL